VLSGHLSNSSDIANNSDVAIAMPQIGSMIMRMLRGTIDVRADLLRSVIATVAVTLITFSGHGAWSQTTRTIKIVVAVPPGGGEDILAGMLGEQIGRAHGLSTLVENRPGAGGDRNRSCIARGDVKALMWTGRGNTVIGPQIDLLVCAKPLCQVFSLGSQTKSMASNCRLGAGEIAFLLLRCV
jgi:hypothetical protein